MELTPRERVKIIFRRSVFSRADLLASGLTSREITAAVRDRRLRRTRRDRYTRETLPKEIAQAAQIGGRLTCISLLKLLGVFVLEATSVHVQLSRNSSRFRRGADGKYRVHWGCLSEGSPMHVTFLEDAVRHSIRCQGARASIATLDSILHHELLTSEQVRRIFRELPVRFGVLLRLVDSSAESGPETYMRMILRALGLRFEAQVQIDGVGRVDFLVEGWLIVECDSKSFHEGWERQKDDRRRDLAAARRGYITVRPLAEDILYRFSVVQATIDEVVAALRPAVTKVRRS